MESSSKVIEAVATAYRSGFTLNLDSEAMAFLAGLYTFAQHNDEARIGNSEVATIFNRVNDVTHGDEDTLARRTRAAIVHLREQRVIVEIQDMGEGFFVLTALGKTIGEEWARTENLTRESLLAYTTTLRMQLDNILAAIRQGLAPEAWENKVYIPLSSAVHALVEKIFHRHQGMTQEQKEIETTISDKINAEWGDAIMSCHDLLSTTGNNLVELHSVLVTESSSLSESLELICDLAIDARQTRCADMAQRILGEVGNIQSWSNRSMEEWGRYYGHANDFIRMVTRIDPNRKISHRIKAAIKAYMDTPWTFVAPDVGRTSCLREEFLVPSRQVAEVFGSPRRATIEERDLLDNNILTQAVAEIERCLSERQELTLAALLQTLAEHYPPNLIFAAIGDIISLMVEAGVPVVEYSPRWQSIDSLDFQALTIFRKLGPKQ